MGWALIYTGDNGNCASQNPFRTLHLSDVGIARDVPNNFCIFRKNDNQTITSTSSPFSRYTTLAHDFHPGDQSYTVGNIQCPNVSKPPLGLMKPVEDITTFILTIHYSLKRKQEMTTHYSLQWLLYIMLNLHYSYWNKSLSSAIHHQTPCSCLWTWKIPSFFLTLSDFSGNKS